MSQTEPAVQHAVLGNVWTMILFRVGAEDAELLEREFRSAMLRRAPTSRSGSAASPASAPEVNAYANLAQYAS